MTGIVWRLTPQTQDTSSCSLLINGIEAPNFCTTGVRATTTLNENIVNAALSDTEITATVTGSKGSRMTIAFSEPVTVEIAKPPTIGAVLLELAL